MKILSYLIPALLTFSSCTTERSDTIISRAPGNFASIKIYGNKIPLDPWQTVLVVEGFGQKDSVMTEVYAENLNSEVVNVAWENENNAKVTFVQTDNTKRVLNIEVSPSILRISE